MHFLSPLSHERLSLLHAAAPYQRVLESAGVIQAFLLVLREGTAYDSPNYLWFSERYAQLLYVDRVVAPTPHTASAASSAAPAAALCLATSPKRSVAERTSSC